MSRPVYEPSPTRTDAVLGYGSDQLFRRPSPTPGVSGVPWIHLKQLDLNQDLTGGNSIILYDDVVNPYPDYFAVDTFGGDPAIVNPLVAGLFQVTVRLYFQTSFDRGIEVNISGVDWDEFLYYSSFINSFDAARMDGVPINTSGGGYAEVMFRNDVYGPEGFSNPTEIYVHVETPGTSSETIILEDQPASGSYMEVRYLGADPFSPLGLDNSNYEG